MKPPTQMTNKKWDVFISYASEDKEEVAIPLAKQLNRAGIKAWFDQQELRLGDSLRDAIDAGLAQSRFGIVILSPSFLAKRWPRHELNGLMSMEELGRKVILPIWHKIDKEYLVSFSPILADRLAANTSNGIEQLVMEITRVVFDRDSGGPGLYQRFSNLLDCESDVSLIRDFIASHPAILACAMNLHSWIEETLVAVHPSIGPFRPDFCVGAFRPTPCDHAWTIVVLGPVTRSVDKAPLTEIGLDPFLKRIRDLRAWLSEDESHEPKDLYGLAGRTYSAEARKEDPMCRDIPSANAIIVCGRRVGLSTAQRSYLSQINGSLEEERIEVRTYDYLLDAVEEARRLDFGAGSTGSLKII